MDCIKNITFLSFHLADYQLFINSETLDDNSKSVEYKIQ
jgi:hypothetical protein